MKRALALALLAAACKGGLYTDKGNAFPCDFNQPEGVRDQVCASGEVCGVDNLCRQYRYEGPQFENGATEPRFGNATVLHPGPLKEPITALTRRVDRDKTLHGLAVMGSGTTATLALMDVGQANVVTTAPYPRDADLISSLAMPNLSSGAAPWAALVTREGGQDRAFISAPDDPGTAVVVRPNNSLVSCDRLRSGNDRVALLRFTGGLPIATSGGEVDGGADYAPYEADAGLPDGGIYFLHPLEARFLPPALLPESADDIMFVMRDPEQLTATLWLRRTGRGTQAMSSPLSAQFLAPPGRTYMRTDATGTVIALTESIRGAAHLLSTWRVDRGPTPSVVRLWPDCSPCKGRIAAFAPTFDLGTPAIEVLCLVPLDGFDESKGARLELIRVVGSSTADETQFCELERLTAPFDLNQVNLLSPRGRRAEDSDAGLEVVFDDAFSFGVAVGGRRGQVWAGQSFSDALPLFLDRVPIAFGLLPGADGGAVPAALTDRYAASPRAVGMGYQVLDFRKGAASPLPEDTVGAALVGQAVGWGLLSSGDLAQIIPGSGGPTNTRLVFGPRLVDSHGAPAHGPFSGEAATAPDGGIISFVLTADDSLYFAAAMSPTLAQDQLPQLTPQLTPAPSSPIRSFALERSQVGTNGVDKVRGYAVAGRALFVVTLDGTPPRWTAKSLLLQGGEPIEVWMDHPLGGLGRVGYRDGEVFTLPGGFLLVNELPRTDGGLPPQVLDYENLGGWPVAMTSNGLFEAHWDVVDGKLQNRFADGGINLAMNWRRVTLDGGAEPWLGKTARLQVYQDRQAWTPESGIVTEPQPASVRVFHLLVYTDEQVIEVGTLSRR